MQPIHELLNRIRWDRELGRGSFAIDYFDRVEDKIIRVSFDEILRVPGNTFSFQIIDREVNHTPCRCIGCGRFIGTGC